MANTDYELQNKNLSPLIDNQFPAFYHDEGPVFVSFVREYYKWMESTQPCANTRIHTNGTVTVEAKSSNVVGRSTSFDSYFANGDPIAIYIDESRSNYNLYTVNTVVNSSFLTLTSDYLPEYSTSGVEYTKVAEQKNPIYYARRLLDNHDVDICEDEFVLLFKEKYLKDMQFSTIIDIRKFIKHSLDLYRSKGTVRSIDLLYKAVFGKPADVYYPSKDLFRLSSGKWFVPKYIELSLNPRNYSLQGKQITGSISKATAFVDSVVRKTVKNRIMDVAYISAINGEFETGENITDGIIPIQECPFMTGSMNQVRIPEDGGGTDFVIGDILDVESATGMGGRVRVTATANNQGILSYELLDGGYGYTEEAEFLFSESVITISNVRTTNTTSYMATFENVYQPLANLHYLNSNGYFTSGSNVYTYHANNDVKGTGRILDISLSNSSAGYLTVAVLSGDLDESAIYEYSNTVTANLDVVDGYSDISATANVVGAYSNVAIVCEEVGTFSIGEVVTQAVSNATGIIQAVVFTDMMQTKANIALMFTDGIFVRGQTITGLTSNASANVQSTTINLGVKDISGNSFMSFGGNYLFANVSNTTGEVTAVSQGSGGELEVTNIEHTETVLFNTNWLIDFASVELDAVAYGFSGDPAANSDSNIFASLDMVEKEIGVIAAINAVSFGTDYNKIPVVKLWDPWMQVYGIRPINDRQYIYISGQTADFLEGELVTQVSSNARGMVISQNSSLITIKRMKYDDTEQFVLTTNSTTTIVGASTGSSANVIDTILELKSPEFGLDADMRISLASGSGVVTNVEVLDSGLGFNEVDLLTMTTGDKVAFGFANLNTIGTGRGFYKSKDGFLSSTKKLHDGWYWQNYSYDIKSSVINSYKTNINKLVHVAGTKGFDTLEYVSDNQIEVQASTEQTIE